MKQAYKKIWCDYGYDWTKVELTGLCKKVTGAVKATDRHYYQAQRRLFGIPIGKYWIPSYDIELVDAEETIYYECNCGEEK